MEPSAKTPALQNPPQRAAELIELTQIRSQLGELVLSAKRQEAQHNKTNALLEELVRLTDGFTSSGSSFQAYQLNPMVLVYAAILGPILGDRIDGTTPKGENYLEEMTQGAAVMAQRLLRTLDKYQSEKGLLSSLEAACGDLNTETSDS